MHEEKSISDVTTSLQDSSLQTLASAPIPGFFMQPSYADTHTNPYYRFLVMIHTSEEKWEEEGMLFIYHEPVESSDMKEDNDPLPEVYVE